MPTEKFPTVNLNGVEIFSSGKWNNDEYSDGDLDKMVSAFNEVGFKPTIKAGHAEGQEDEKTARKVFGAPALGYVNKIQRQGKKLVADITDVPRKFADLIKSGAYKRVSSEVYWNYKDDQHGKTHPRVLKSVAFLGADVPAITNLKEVEALYHKNPEGGLYAYDDIGEYRVYTADVADPAPILVRFKDEGVYTIKEEEGGYCVYSPDGKKIKTWATLDEAKKSVEGYNSKVVGMKPDEGNDEKEETETEETEEKPVKEFPKKFPKKFSGGKQMDQQDFDEQMKAQIEKLKAELQKEYEYRVHKAREDGKAEAETANDSLREEIRKLQSEKRSERIESWLKRMKADGKLTPAEESKVRALREWIPDEDSSLKYFSLKDGKTQEHAGSPAEIFESLFENRASVFKVFSKDGTEEDDSGKELDDAGAEVDRRAKLYQQKQASAGTTVTYSQAVSNVLKTDKALAHRYHSMDRH